MLIVFAQFQQRNDSSQMHVRDEGAAMVRRLCGFVWASGMDGIRSREDFVRGRARQRMKKQKDLKFKKAIGNLGNLNSHSV